MRTGTGWSLCCTGSAAIFRGGADGRRQSAFVNLADRSPLFQQLRSRLKSRAPVSCTGSSWVIGIRASTPKEADQGCRAISGPLTPVTSGLSRSLTDSPLRRSGHITGPDGTDSQADSAGSIPVTRSNPESPVQEPFGTLAGLCREQPPRVPCPLRARWVVNAGQLGADAFADGRGDHLVSLRGAVLVDEHPLGPVNTRLPSLVQRTHPGETRRQAAGMQVWIRCACWLAARELGRSGRECSAYHLNNACLDPKRAACRVNVASAERGQFVPPKSCRDGEQNEEPVSGMGCVGQREDLTDGQNRALGWRLRGERSRLDSRQTRVGVGAWHENCIQGQT